MVEEGRLSQGWQSPLQRRLAQDKRLQTDLGRKTHPRVGEAGTFVVGRLRGASRSNQEVHAVFHPIDGFGFMDSVLQRKAESLGSVNGADGARVLSNGWGRKVAATMAGNRRAAKEWTHADGLRLPGDVEGGDVCPLVYSVDANTAKKHGLHLFQVSIPYTSDFFHPGSEEHTHRSFF